MLSNPWNEPILIVNESPEGSSLLKKALLEIGAGGKIIMLGSCEDAFNYIKGTPPYDDRTAHPFPLVIYIGLNAENKNGLKLLHWLKENPECSIIPAVMLASDFEDEDVKEAYHQGVNAFLKMPSNLNDLTTVIRRSMEFWRVCQKPRYMQNC